MHVQLKYEFAHTVKGRSTHSDLNIKRRMERRPSVNIVDVAEKEVYDLMVKGSRGIGGIEGWILGSPSRRVVDSCKTPVLII